MKFALLASGRIAENFISDPRFEQTLKSNLCGVIASQSVVEDMTRRFSAAAEMPTYHIADKRLNEEQLTELIDAVRPDYLLSIQYPWILPSDILTGLCGRVVNLHNARLPDYRGHNSISHEILNNETVHTTTLHWVAAEVDRGRVVMTRDIPIHTDDTAYSLWTRSLESALILLEDWFLRLVDLRNFPEGEAVAAGGKYYSKDISLHKEIPAGSAIDVTDKWARAFWFPPHEPAYMYNGKAKLYVLPNTWQYDAEKSY